MLYLHYDEDIFGLLSFKEGSPSIAGDFYIPYGKNSGSCVLVERETGCETTVEYTVEAGLFHVVCNELEILLNVSNTPVQYKGSLLDVDYTLVAVYSHVELQNLFNLGYFFKIS